MKITPLLLVAGLFISNSTVSAEEPRYRMMPISAIFEQMGGDENEKPFKAWMKEHRPEQYSKLFEKGEDDAAGEEGAEEGKEKEKEKKGFFSAFAEISRALAEPRIALLDYYVNKMAEDGWRVVSMGEGMILFERREARQRRRGTGSAEE